MPSPIAYGIDFGTTNSVVAAAYPERVEVLGCESGGDSRVQSLLCITATGNRLVGKSAWRQYTTRPDQSHMVFAAKGVLADRNLIASIWGQPRKPRDLASWILSDLKLRADRVTGADVRRAVIGYPVVFDGAEGVRFEELQGHAMRELTHAAHDAGFEDVELMAEPQAAMPVQAGADGKVVVVDFGGGTFDVMVADCERGHTKALAFRGRAYGGQKLDEAVFYRFVAEQMGLCDSYVVSGKPLPFPAWVKCGLASWGGMQKIHRNLRAPLGPFYSARGGERVQWVRAVLEGGQAYSYLSSIERAKMQLSDHDAGWVSFGWPDFSRDLPTTRSELEAEIKAELEKCLDLVDDALDEAGLGWEDVVRVVRTGGSAQVPLLHHMLVERFGETRIQDADRYASVAYGLANHAQGIWA